MQIEEHKIGQGNPTFIIAEMSANHHHDFEQAVKIIEAAKESGADAIKLQTYTPDTMTIDCANEYFQIKGTIWKGKKLYDLYGEAYTPWEWQPKLKKIADDLGLVFFSTPFDHTAVDFLEDMEVPCYKIASFEVIDLPLIEKIARTGKPIIMSTGMASLGEIEDAVRTARQDGTEELALLKCTSAYPATPDDMNLATIPHLAEAFQVIAGLSDHTLGITVPVAAVALGASIIEKHFTLSRSIPGPDSAFSLEPQELKSMVEAVRTAEKALGQVRYGTSSDESASTIFRRSLFFVESLKEGEMITEKKVRSIRPGDGLAPKYLKDILGRRAAKDIYRGTPVAWDLLAG